MTNTNTALNAAINYLIDGCKLTESGLYVVRDQSAMNVLLATEDDLATFGAALTGDAEADSDAYADFCHDIPGDRVIPMIGSMNLQSLFHSVVTLHKNRVTADEVWGVSMDALPTFGGDDVEDTDGVWSWDESSILIGEGTDTMEIVARDGR